MNAKDRLIEIISDLLIVEDPNHQEEIADAILKEFWHESESKYVYIPIDGKASFEKVAQDWAKMNKYIPIKDAPKYCEVKQQEATQWQKHIHGLRKGKIVPLNTAIPPYGRVTGVLYIGEGYYLLAGGDATVSLVPADMIEDIYENLPNREDKPCTTE